MENTNTLVIDGKQAALECKNAASRCNLGLIIYLLVASCVATAISFGLGVFEIFNPGSYEAILANPLYKSILVWGTQILAMYLIAYPAFYLFTKRLPRRDVSEKQKLTFMEFIKLAIAAEGVMLIGSMVAGYVTDLLNEKLGIVVEDTTSELISQTNIGIIILVVVIIGPIFEELIFRKIFIDTIGKNNIRLAILMSAASFALFHGNITQAIYTFGAGLILAFVYAKTKNFLYPALLHIFINFFGTVPSLLVMDSYDRIMNMTEEELYASTDPAVYQDIMILNAYTIMTYGFIILGAWFLLNMLFKGYFKLPKGDEVKIPFGKKLGILFFNWGTVIFVVYSLVTILLDIFTPLIEEMIAGMGV